MSNQNSLDDLIDNLSEDLQPVKKLACPVLRMLPWVVGTLIYLGGVLYFMGVRHDLGEQFQNAAFLFEMLLLLSMSLSAAYTAGLLSIPDMQGKKWMLAVPSTLFAVFMGRMLIEVVLSLPTMMDVRMGWHHCMGDALLMLALPVLAITFIVKRGATTLPYWCSFMSAVAAGGAGWMTMRITCGAEHIAHIFVYHFTPFFIVAVLLGLVAARLYRW